MSLFERKKLELDAKSHALAGELAHWRAVSAANQPYEKHHSQIARISARLESVIGGIAKEVTALGDTADAVLIAGQRIEERLLAAHLVWDFFRSRLAMRGDPFLKMYLDACDEFAWSCYEGARKRFFEAQEARAATTNAGVAAAAGGSSEAQEARGAVAAANAGGAAAAGASSTVGKEPPLVFLNGGWSPFAVSRERALDLDRPAFNVAGGTIAWLETGEFHSVVRDLPFPMLGVPWYQLRHLPDALVLGHEMGHVLEWDFQLKPDMEAALAAPLMSFERRSAWTSWRMEIFADIVGTLAGGPRFGGALMDFLATIPAKIQQERRAIGAWGAYPMRWLRIELVASALRYTGFEKDAAKLRADWQQAYGAPTAQSQAEFIEDVPAVVAALIDGPYTALGGAKLTDIVSFRTDASGAPYDEAVVDAIFGQGSLDLANPREFFAAARLIYERDPAGFAKQDYNTRICELVNEHRMPGTRGTPFDTLDALEAAEAALADDWLFGK